MQAAMMHSQQHQHQMNNNHQLKALPHSTSLGAPLLSIPAPASSLTTSTSNATTSSSSRSSLLHLVGRPLVPFFCEDGLAENINQYHHAGTAHLNFSVDGDKSTVRIFKDGYFVEQGLL